MRPTRCETMKNGERLAVAIQELTAMLGCGKATARKIGMEAGAAVKIGGRTLYYLPKVKDYLSSLAGSDD